MDQKTVLIQRAVAIGGSTGALSVLKQVLPLLPFDMTAPVFVTVHVGSESPNLLANILEIGTGLHVSTAQQGELAQPGRVYVAPADGHLLVIDGYIRFGRGPRENLARPSIDALFRSVAVCYGAGAVGVVLTGHLNDGAAGLAAIKQCGGLSAFKALVMRLPLTCHWGRLKQAISITARLRLTSAS